MASEPTADISSTPTIRLTKTHPNLLPFTLRWPLFEPLTSILILDDRTNASSHQRPFQNPDDGTFHPIANLRLTNPPVASLTVKLQTLEDAYDSFVDMHARHQDEKYEPENGVDGARCIWGSCEG